MQAELQQLRQISGLLTENGVREVKRKKVKMGKYSFNSKYKRRYPYWPTQNTKQRKRRRGVRDTKGEIK